MLFFFLNLLERYFEKIIKFSTTLEIHEWNDNSLFFSNIISEIAGEDFEQEFSNEAFENCIYLLIIYHENILTDEYSNYDLFPLYFYSDIIAEFLNKKIIKNIKEKSEIIGFFFQELIFKNIFKINEVGLNEDEIIFGNFTFKRSDILINYLNILINFFRENINLRYFWNNIEIDNALIEHIQFLKGTWILESIRVLFLLWETYLYLNQDKQITTTAILNDAQCTKIVHALIDNNNSYFTSNGLLKFLVEAANWEENGKFLIKIRNELLDITNNFIDDLKETVIHFFKNLSKCLVWKDILLTDQFFRNLKIYIENTYLGSSNDSDLIYNNTYLHMEVETSLNLLKSINKQGFRSIGF